ncbi:MAG TPA: glycosyltransferase [Xanthobacteraceae bacterium]|jgi:glycosyltransferase involved in cell wall biosynthesis|nr:glycosyltransferase [Xanthobacteraceae bacterium]
MNVVQALAWYFPDSVGGTEIYVSGLTRELATRGIASTIVAAADGVHSADYSYNDIVVHRYPFADRNDLAAIRGDAPPRDFKAFVAWLDTQPRGIYHQHSWTASCGLHHIRVAKSLGFKTVLTVHVPAYTCLRGTMMKFGIDPCDGRVEAVRCSACWSQSRGASRALAEVLGRAPRFVSSAAYRSGSDSRVLTAIGARELAETRKQQITAVADSADRIVAVCDWLLNALRANGIDERKLILSRQGIDRPFTVPIRDWSSDVFRFGFLGRCDPVKGLPILLDAVALLPRDLNFELIIHAVANTDDDRRRRDALMAKVSRDARIKFLPPVPHAELASVVAGFNMLAVPSQWLETGPLVVLEAKACGVPILGSDLGGIAELVTAGVDGHLVPFSKPEAWADAIRDAICGKLDGLRGPRTPRTIRTMADAANDMAALYAALA